MECAFLSLFPSSSFLSLSHGDARLNLICDDVAQAKLLESASASASEAAAATIKSEL